MHINFLFLACLLFVMIALALVARKFGITTYNNTIGSRPLFTPDGSRIVFGGYRGGRVQICTIALNGSQLTQISSTPFSKRQPAFSPDGKHIAFVSSSRRWEAHINVTSADGTEQRRLTKSEFYDSDPSFSPDSSKIVFCRAHLFRSYSLGGYMWNDYDVCVINTDGTGEKRLTSGQYYSMSAPYFSPDGNKIVFAAYIRRDDGYHNNHEVLVIPSDGHLPPSQLTHGPLMKGPTPPFPWISSDPSFSPDGEKIVFISDRTKKYEYEVWVMNADGTNPVQVTSNHSYNTNPCFSPDCKTIVFLSDPSRKHSPSLWRIDADGRNLMRIGCWDLFYQP